MINIPIESSQDEISFIVFHTSTRHGNDMFDEKLPINPGRWAFRRNLRDILISCYYRIHWFLMFVNYQHDCRPNGRYICARLVGT